MPFLARLVQDGWTSEGRRIGVDARTAVLVEASGLATVVGSGAAYFLRAPAPASCQPGTPLRIAGVAVCRAVDGATFDLRAWAGSGGSVYRLSAASGSLASDQAGGGV